MARDDWTIVRARFLCGLAIITYPGVLAFALIYKLFSTLFGNARKNVAGDVALITGGGNGLGRCIAIELAKEGCRIAVADIDYEGAKKTAEMLKEKYNVNAKAYKVDISKYDEVAALNADITNDLGAATILINNAGVLVLSNHMQPDWQEVQRMINVNLTSHFWTNQVFLPNMKAKRKGHIVAISSLAGMMPMAFSSQYTSTKYAVRGMMRSLRLELKANRSVNGEEIYATTVYPNFLQTNARVADIVRKTGLDELYPLMTGEIVAKRLVSGMLRNEEEIIMPGIMGLMYKLYETLPATFQDLLLFTQAYFVVKKIKKLQT